MKSVKYRLWARAAIGVFFVLVLFDLTYGPLTELGQTLAQHKPGMWANPAWYIVLLAGLALLLMALLSLALWFVLKGVAVWRSWVAILVALAFVRGLLYATIVPPWQAPDEHAHFEYAALLGELGRVPTQDDISPDLQQRIVKSMFDYDLWRFIKRKPVDAPPVGFLVQGSINRPPATHVVDNRYLYYPQVNTDPPLYYAAPAVVYAFLRGADTATQLYAMRLVSVSMFVGLILAVVWGTKQLCQDDMVLCMSVPVVVLFHPMLTHMGSVLNNDILATLVVTLLLVVLVITLRDGVSLRRGLVLAVLLGLVLFTKPSALWVVVLVGAACLASLVRRWGWVRYLILVASVVVGLLSYCSLRMPSEQARCWVPISASWTMTVTDKVAFDGEHALRVEGDAQERSALGQVLSAQTALDLRGREVVLTAYVRTPAGENGGGALFVEDMDYGRSFEQDFIANPSWQEVWLRFTVPDDVLHLRVGLAADAGSVLYFDRVTIVDSSAPDAQIACLQDSSGEQVRSLGEVILVELGDRFGLAKPVEWVFTPWLSNLPVLLSSIAVPRFVFRSFWGNFGAALVIPLPPGAYLVLRYMCVVGFLGLCVFVLRVRLTRSWVCRPWQYAALQMLGAAVLVSAFVVSIPWVLKRGEWIPQGRYLLPVVWPVGVLLVLGLDQWVPRCLRRWLLLVVVIGMGLLDFVALRELVLYFHI